MAVSAWIKCGHCKEPLVKLTPSDLLSVIYSMDLQSGLRTELLETSPSTRGYREQYIQLGYAGVRLQQRKEAHRHLQHPRSY